MTDAFISRLYTDLDLANFDVNPDNFKNRVIVLRNRYCNRPLVHDNLCNFASLLLKYVQHSTVMTPAQLAVVEKVELIAKEYWDDMYVEKRTR
jgi:hypothetical protein